MLDQNNLLNTKISITKLYERSNTSAKHNTNDMKPFMKDNELDLSDDETLSTCSGITSSAYS